MPGSAWGVRSLRQLKYESMPPRIEDLIGMLASVQTGVIGWNTPWGAKADWPSTGGEMSSLGGWRVFDCAARPKIFAGAHNGLGTGGHDGRVTFCMCASGAMAAAQRRRHFKAHEAQTEIPERRFQQVLAVEEHGIENVTISQLPIDPQHGAVEDMLIPAHADSEWAAGRERWARLGSVVARALPSGR